jgi:hypothetical protein
MRPKSIKDNHSRKSQHVHRAHLAAGSKRNAAHALVFASFNPDILTMVKAARTDMQAAILFGGVVSAG